MVSKQKMNGALPEAEVTTNRILIFGEAMTRGTFSGRYHDGARIVAQPASGMLPAGHDLLFLVRADGQLAPVTRAGEEAAEALQPVGAVRAVHPEGGQLAHEVGDVQVQGAGRQDAGLVVLFR